MANCISNTYRYLLDKYMPLQKLSRKERRFFHKPWISKAIKNSIKTKNKLFRKWKRKNNTKSEAEYKSYRNILRNIKRKAYEQYYREKIEKYGHDKSKTWGLINEISKRSRRKKASIKCLKSENGSKVNTGAGIANRLNNHFSSVGKKWLMLLKI